MRPSEKPDACGAGVTDHGATAADYDLVHAWFVAFHQRLGYRATNDRLVLGFVA